MAEKKNKLHQQEAQLHLLLARWKEWYVVVVVILIIGLSLLLVLMPAFGQTVESYQDIGKTEKKLTQLVQKRSLLEELNSGSLQQSIQLVQKALPNSKPILQMFLGLQQLAGQNNVAIGSYVLSPGLVDENGDSNKKTKQGELEDIALELSVVGGETDVDGFVKGLETVMPLMEVDTISLSKQRKEASQNYEAKINLLIHYSLPPKELGSVSSLLKELSSRDETILTALQSYTQADQGQAVQPVFNDNRVDVFSFSDTQLSTPNPSNSSIVQ